jgi:hypothetical protein
LWILGNIVKVRPIAEILALIFILDIVKKIIFELWFRIGFTINSVIKNKQIG